MQTADPDAPIEAIVLFSGPGGSSLGLRNAGVARTTGVEFDPSYKKAGVQPAVATALAAGLETVQSDVRTLDPLDFAPLERLYHLLVQASPPCQGLSMAGKGKGRDDLVHLLKVLKIIAGLPMESTAQWARWYIAHLEKVCSDDRSPLTFEVVRWVAKLNPEYVMLEQVPAALPIWQAIGEVLEAWGYSVWTGNVQAEQYGVPQTRKRAMLIASRLHEVSRPRPTRSKYHTRDRARLDDGVEPWVSMAEALGWGVTEAIGFPRKYDGHGEAVEIDGELYRGRDLREAENPSFVVTEKARSWRRFSHMGDVYNSKGCIRSLDEPAPTMTASMDNGNFQFFDAENPPAKVVDRLALRAEVEPRVNNQSGTEFDLTWPADRPAPVIAGRGLVPMPGANANRFNGSTKSRNDGIRVSVEEAGVLQSFPGDYPWQGTMTAQFQQVGNAVPPLLQEALTRSLLADREAWRQEATEAA